MIQGEIDITVKNNEKLMLQALSSLYPYDIILHFDDALDEEDQALYSLRENDGRILVNDAYYLLEVKPYLRPMSSMTEEEEKEYINIDNRSYSCPINYAHIPASERIDWLNANKFDYRGLIPMGLAIEVTKENNPYKD